MPQSTKGTDLITQNELRAFNALQRKLLKISDRFKRSRNALLRRYQSGTAVEKGDLELVVSADRSRCFTFETNSPEMGPGWVTDMIQRSSLKAPRGRP